MEMLILLSVAALAIAKSGRQFFSISQNLLYCTWWSKDDFYMFEHSLREEYLDYSNQSNDT